LHAERAAATRFAVERNAAAHARDQFAADRQAQSAAAVAVRTVGLFETLEQSRTRGFGDARAGVADSEVDAGQETQCAGQ